MMETMEFYTLNTFNVLVKKILDSHTTEWFGSLTLILKENGETFLDISFSDQEIIHELHDQPWNLKNAGLSVEIMENCNLQKVETLDNTA
jgi:hypothetical protein